MSEPIRAHKYLAQLGLTSRRNAEVWIRAGRLHKNGSPVCIGESVIPGEDHLTLDSKPLGQRTPPKIYWLLNKPRQTLVSRKPEPGQNTIYDLPSLKKSKFHIFAVGRLDYMSEGLLLITNDGDFSQKLSHPKYQVERSYQVLSQRKLNPAELTSIRKGVTLKDGVLRCRIQQLGSQSLGGSRGCWYRVTLKEGRNRAVRRLFESFDVKVLRLIRDRYGSLELPSDLKPGACCSLSPKDKKLLVS